MVFLCPQQSREPLNSGKNTSNQEIFQDFSKTKAICTYYCINYVCCWNSDLLAPNGKFLEENDTLKRPLYADTLEMIAWNGAGWFYDSDFMREMVQELKEDHGSILTEQDFKEYIAVERRATQSYYSGFSVRGVASPSGGPVLGLILNILDSKQLSI